MSSKPGRKEITHDRILDTAARAIRRTGYAGAGVADIMKEAGLTHGGFYAHFPSRDAMLAEAVQRAGQNAAEQLAAQAAARHAQGASPFRAVVESYLSDAHLASLESGCPVAALVSEMPRQSPEVQEAARARIAGLLDMVCHTLPDPAKRDIAMMVFSAMVGALQLARAQGNTDQGKSMLAATREHLIAQYDTNTDPAPA